MPKERQIIKVANNANKSKTLVVGVNHKLWLVRSYAVADFFSDIAINRFK